MNLRLSILLLGLLLPAASILTGCTTAGAGAGRYLVTSPKSPFYKYGPAQAFGADFALTRGQRVTVLENSFGFSRVVTDDGIAGFMATDDLVVAPPDPLPPQRSAPRTASRRIRGSNGSRGGGNGLMNDPADPIPRSRKSPPKIEPGLPLFEVNDLPLPTDADKPAAPTPPPDAPAPSR